MDVEFGGPWSSDKSPASRGDTLARRRRTMSESGQMNRKTFLQITGTCLAGAALPSCATPGPEAGQRVSWPGVRFVRVRAFVYDCDVDKTVGFLQKEGRICRGVINGPGVVLTSSQVNRLLSTLTMSTKRKGRTACFVPHHAFVFYDAADHVVAHAEICFNCTTLRSYPAGLPEHIDFPAIWSLLMEAGVPVGPGSQFYKDLYQSGQPRL